MAYRVRHRKADGTSTTTRINGKRSVRVDRAADGVTTGIVIRNGPRNRKIAYNFNKLLGGKNLSKKEREDRIRTHLAKLRSEYRHTKGNSKEGTRRHVASIPPEIAASEMAENGPGLYSDPERLKKVISEHQLWVAKL